MGWSRAGAWNSGIAGLTSVGGTQLVVASGYQLLLPDGSAGAPSLVFTSDPTMGWVYASGSWDFYGGSTKRVTIPAGGGITVWSGSFGIRNDSGILFFGSSVDVILSRVATGSLGLTMGGGTGVGHILSKASIGTTNVGNIGAGEDVLITYSLPASSLNTTGGGVRITAWGSTANNANAKTLKLYFGTTAIANYSLTVSIAGVWKITGDVYRTGASAQKYNASLVTLGAASVALNYINMGTCAETDTNAIVIQCTGEATANDDIIQQGMMVEFLN